MACPFCGNGSLASTSCNNPLAPRSGDTSSGTDGSLLWTSGPQGPEQGSTIRVGSPPSKEAGEWLDAHNRLRCLHNVTALAWDAQLENLANSWADYWLRRNAYHALDTTMSWELPHNSPQIPPGYGRGNLGAPSLNVEVFASPNLTLQPMGDDIVSLPTWTTQMWYSNIAFTDKGACGPGTSCELNNGMFPYQKALWAAARQLGCTIRKTTQQQEQRRRYWNRPSKWIICAYFPGVMGAEKYLARNLKPRSVDPALCNAPRSWAAKHPPQIP